MEILRTVTRDADGVKKLGETLKDVMDPAVCQGLVHIMETVKDVAEADFGLEFDPTLVRGMSYYTGTIFEVSMEGFGGSVAVSYTHLYEAIGACVKNQKGVVVVSSEEEEVLGICDRVIVMKNGCIAAILNAKTATTEEIKHYAV